jgi:predicted RNase H-like nuclease (RuvC/YqgF family)
LEAEKSELQHKNNQQQDKIEEMQKEHGAKVDNLQKDNMALQMSVTKLQFLQPGDYESLESRLNGTENEVAEVRRSLKTQQKEIIKGKILFLFLNIGTKRCFRFSLDWDCDRSLQNQTLWHGS